MDTCFVAHLKRWLLLLVAATLGFSVSAQTPPGPVATQAGSAAATQWVAVRGQAIDLSITPGGDVYALDPEGRLWRLAAQNIREGTADNWLTQPGRFKRLRATHDGGLWALDPSDLLYQLRGSVWRPVAERIKDVAASPDGQILVLGARGDFFDFYTGKSFEPPPPSAGSPLERLVADAHGLPWLQRQDRSVVRFDGTAWQTVASASDGLATLTAGNDGTILGIGLDGRVLRYMPQGNTWQPYITDGRVIPPLRHLAIHPSGMPWGIARSGELLAERSVGAPKAIQSTPAAFTKLLTWRTVGGPSTKVSVGSDGTTFSIAPDGTVWRRKRGNEWTRINAQVEAIAAAAGGQAWGLNAKGGIVHFNQGFIPDIPGIVRLIAVGPKNDLWAVFPDNFLRKWNARAKQWDGVMPLLPEVPVAISIGKGEEPWIIDSEGMVKTYTEKRWRPVPGIKARSIGVGPEGTVYAASDTEGIYWLDTREMKWKPASGKAVQIAVGPGGAPWAITAKNELLASGRFIDADNVREAVAQAAAKKAASPTTPSSTTTTSTTTASTTTADTTTASTTTTGSSTPSAFTSQSTPSAFTSGSSAPSVFTSGATAPDGTKPAIVFTGPLPATIKPLSYQTLFGETRFKDIGIGANGAVYAASVDGALMCFNNAANRFIIASSGTVDRVTVTADGMPWILDASGRISRFDKDRSAWRVVPSFSGVDISIGPDGQLWAAGTSG